MHPIIKDTLFASIFLVITYFGFIHNVEILQIAVGALYTLALIFIPISLIFFYANFKEAIKFRDTLKTNYKANNFVTSLFVVPITCWIFYTSSSYNFLAIYIIIILLANIMRYKTYTIVKNR